MTKYNAFDMQNIKNTCRACLKVTEEVYPMTDEEMQAYQSFAGKFTINSCDTKYNMSTLCIICKWMLQKCMKFVHQIKKVNKVLLDISNMESKSYNLDNLTTFDFIVSQPLVHYLGPTDELDGPLSDRDDFLLDNDDDDEIPLVMLQDYKSRKRKFEQELPPTDIKVEDVQEELDKNKRCNKKNKKELREGFSSRMVQETDEYIVIKLSTEQVLQELSEKAKTDVYVRSPYKCEKCVKGFNFEDVLYTHMEKHRPENGSYECLICSQYCPSPVSLRGHMKSHTTRYKCKICNQVRLSRQHLLEHYAITHTAASNTYTCELCHFTSNKRTVIQRHVKSHGTSEKHTCHACGKLFNTIESLRIHTMRHDKSKRLQCTQCDKYFIYPSLLHKHIQAVHERKDYYCVECDVNFKSPESLRLHFKKAKRHRDSSSFRYECTHCHQRFVSTATLSVHLTSTHGEPKQHACDVCNNHYSSKEALRAHIWRVHTHKKEAQTTCNVCDKSFTRSSVVKAHVRTHTTHTGAQVCVCTDTHHTQKQETPNIPTIEVPQET